MPRKLPAQRDWWMSKLIELAPGNSDVVVYQRFLLYFPKDPNAPRLIVPSTTARQVNVS